MFELVDDRDVVLGAAVDVVALPVPRVGDVVAALTEDRVVAGAGIDDVVTASDVDRRAPPASSLLRQGRGA